MADGSARTLTEDHTLLQCRHYFFTDAQQPNITPVSVNISASYVREAVKHTTLQSRGQGDVSPRWGMCGGGVAEKSFVSSGRVGKCDVACLVFLVSPQNQPVGTKEQKISLFGQMTGLVRGRLRLSPWQTRQHKSPLGRCVPRAGPY